MHQQTTIEYAVIGLYFLFMLATAILFQRYNKQFGDYFRSGCQGSWWLVGSSVFMASFTAWTYTGAVGVACKSGITVSVIFMANGAGYLVNALLTARWFRQMRAVTYPEVVKARFGSLTQQFYILVGVIPGILIASLNLWSVALFSSSVFGLNQTNLIIGIGSVVLVYSTIGGLWGVMATDFLQALILLPMTVLVAVLSLSAVGGVGGLLAEIRAQELDNMLRLVDASEGATYNPGWAVAMFLFVFLSYNSLGSSVKYFATKDGREASKAAALASVLMFAGSLLWIIPPVVARLKFPELVESQHLSEPAESAYAVIAMQLLPAGLTGMIVVAMFAATMSSLSTIFNQFAAVVTQDVYKPLLKATTKRDVGDGELFFVGKIATMVVGGLIIAMAVHLASREGGGLFDSMLLFGSLFGTPMVVPLFLLLFVRKTPPWSAIFSVCVGFVFSVIAYTMKFSYTWTVFSITLASSISYVLTVPFWRRSSEPYRRRVGAFYKQMHTPVNFRKEVGEDNDVGQLRLIGAVACAIAGFIFLIIAVPNSLKGRLQIAAVSLSVLAFGLMMLFAARHTDRRIRKATGTNTIEEHTAERT